MITISDNNEIFVAGGNDNKAHVFINKGDYFVNHDTLIHSTHDVNVAEITGDG